MQAVMNEQEAKEKAKVVASCIDAILVSHGCRINWDVGMVNISYYDSSGDFKTVGVPMENWPL